MDGGSESEPSVGSHASDQSRSSKQKPKKINFLTIELKEEKKPAKKKKGKRNKSKNLDNNSMRDSVSLSPARCKDKDRVTEEKKAGAFNELKEKLKKNVESKRKAIIGNNIMKSIGHKIRVMSPPVRKSESPAVSMKPKKGKGKRSKS